MARATTTSSSPTSTSTDATRLCLAPWSSTTTATACRPRASVMATPSTWDSSTPIARDCRCTPAMRTGRPTTTATPPPQRYSTVWPAAATMAVACLPTSPTACRAPLGRRPTTGPSAPSLPSMPRVCPTAIGSATCSASIGTATCSTRTTTPPASTSLRTRAPSPCLAP